MAAAMSDTMNHLSWATSAEASVLVIAPLGWTGSGQNSTARRRLQAYVKGGLDALAARLEERVRLLLVATHAELGCKWDRVGVDKPAQGRDLHSAHAGPGVEQLAKGLASKTDFTHDEWAAFNIRDLRKGDFVRSEDLYFRPADVEGEHKAVQNWLKELRKTCKRNVKQLSISRDPAELCRELCTGTAIEAPSKFPAVLVMQGATPKAAVEGLLDEDLQAVLSAVGQRSTVASSARAGGVGNFAGGSIKTGASAAAGSGGSGGAAGTGGVHRNAETLCSDTINELMLETLDAASELTSGVSKLARELDQPGIKGWQGVCSDENKRRMEQLLARIKPKARGESQAPLHLDLKGARDALKQVRSDLDRAERALETTGDDQPSQYLCESVRQLSLKEAVGESADGRGGLPAWLEHELAPLASLSRVQDKAVRRAAEAPLVARVRERQSRFVRIAGAVQGDGARPEGAVNGDYAKTGDLANGRAVYRKVGAADRALWYDNDGLWRCGLITNVATATGYACVQTAAASPERAAGAVWRVLASDGRWVEQAAVTVSAVTDTEVQADLSDLAQALHASTIGSPGPSHQRADLQGRGESPPKTPLPYAATEARPSGGKTRSPASPEVAYGILNMSPGGRSLAAERAERALSMPALPDSADKRERRKDKIWKTPLAKLLGSAGGSGSTPPQPRGSGSCLSLARMLARSLSFMCVYVSMCVCVSVRACVRAGGRAGGRVRTC